MWLCLLNIVCDSWKGTLSYGKGLAKRYEIHVTYPTMLDKALVQAECMYKIYV